jgi:hypothetical protein
MVEHMRLNEALTLDEQRQVARGKAPTTVKNEMLVRRRFAAWYGDVQLRQ